MTCTVAYVTGSRADFGRIITTLHHLKKRNITPKLIVTGSHFSKKHGYTINEAEKENFEILAELDTIVAGDELYHMVDTFGKTIKSINNVLKKQDIDLLLVLGDRGEMLAAALCAAHLNIPVAHIGGGQTSGSIDNSIRDAITVFSDFHFCATEKNKKRIPDIKGSSSNIFVVGDPDIDMIKKMEFPSRDDVLRRYGLDPDKKVFLFIQHPVTDEIDKSEKYIESVLDALSVFDCQIITIIPNMDAGGQKMNEVIQSYQKIKDMKTFSNIHYKDFLSLMNSVDLMIGNSSAGIIESASFKLPVVNIGNRQRNREQSKNVINTSYKTSEIISVIKKALDNDFKLEVEKCENIYGSGNTAEKIADIIYNYLGDKIS